MSGKQRLRVVLLWHMHQPEYRDLSDGRYQLPWTYLHAIKDYVDMAALLEQIPGARAVVNFVPILLEQIDDYAGQLRDCKEKGQPLRDPLLAALSAQDMSVFADDEREQLVQACLRANEERLINRFPAYRRLADIAGAALDKPGMGAYLGEAMLADVLVWYHLAWLGETVRIHDRRIQQLIEKERGYDVDDRQTLLTVIAELTGTLIERYRRLADQGKVELSMTPYAHPMVPLLLDFNSARESLPDSPLPETPFYPGGRERAEWHFETGLNVFEKYFGQRPRGCWPSEGGVSDATVDMLQAYGFDWLATGETVLRNSLAHMSLPQDEPMETRLHRAYRISERSPVCFFRDDGLSDLIGFTYSGWHGDDAVSNLVHHLENIASECPDGNQRVVSIVLDGENAWESYPSNGYHFLSALYRTLAEHPDMELTTFADCVDQGAGNVRLQHLVAGSWVYGTFSTWMGDADKNRGWDLLCAAKAVFDEVMEAGELDEQTRQQAIAQLAVCEGSDWFWWFGDYNPSDTVSDFDRLYRLHLHRLYILLGRPAPADLEMVISVGGGDPAQGGVMRPGQAVAH